MTAFRLLPATALGVALMTSGAANPARGADGTQAVEPNFWEVVNVDTSSVLNIMTRPSSRSSLVVQVRNGTILRNQGCRITADAQWCRVALSSGFAAGWVDGRYLAAAAAE